MKYASEEAEALILSAILNNHPQYLDQITDEDITTTSYQTILKAFRQLQDKHSEIDMVTTGIELQSMNREGLATILMQVSDQYFKGINYESYMNIIKTNTAKRKIWSGLQYVQDQLKLDNPADIKSNILDYFSGVPLPGQKQDDSLKTILLKTRDHLENAYKNKDDKSYHTGIPDLDGFTGGMHRGEMTILAARPSVGKTALGMQISTQMAQKGKIVQCFSREMSQIQVGTRIIANQGGVDGQRMRTGNIRDEDWVNISHTMMKLSPISLYINDEAATMPDIRAVCMEKLHKGLDLVMIDYLQLLRSAKKTDTREREVAEMSRAIKEMTLELNIPIIVLSQLNRSASNRRPTLDTLRESGSLEQDADNVIMLHRPDEEDVEPNERTVFQAIQKQGKEYVEVILAKQRNGPTGLFASIYNPKYLKFEPISRRDER